MEIIHVIIQGFLLGGLYALFAAGLSLIFGVMRLVNIAHGDLIVVAAYMAYFTMRWVSVRSRRSLSWCRQSRSSATRCSADC